MGAFKPCAGCSFLYRRVYAWGGCFADAPGGLYSGGAKSDFVACYNSAITLVNSIDINTVPFGSVRWFDYGGWHGETKLDCTYIDHGNVINNPTNLPGSSGGTPPCGTSDYGAIVGGGTDYSYMGGVNPGFGVNAGGYRSAAWTGKGNFAISRIQVQISNQPCTSKWSVVYWDGNTSFPSPGHYTIECQCDATSSGSCAACENGSTTGAVCVDIPPATWFTQDDADFDVSSQYFVPGFNCADLT
jgi:hypothetical protein